MLEEEKSAKITVRRINKMEFESENIEIDPSAKLVVPLNAKSGQEGNFYLGKLQFNGSLDFETGLNFMIFIAEKGFEELHIGTLDHKRVNNNGPYGSINLGTGLRIDLRSHLDRDRNTYYIGEAIAPASLDMRRGIAFSIFVNDEATSSEDEGEIAKYSYMDISRLIVRPRRTDFRQQDFRQQGNRVLENRVPENRIPETSRRQGFRPRT